MKKLMIAAAVAALTAGSYASLCDDEPEDVAGCAAYDVKITLKTLAPKVLKGSKNQGDDVCVYLADGKRNLKGIIWMCEEACAFLDADGNNAKMILWRTDKKFQSAIGNTLGWDAAAQEWVAEEFNVDILDRYAKKADKVEALWKIDGLVATKKNGDQGGEYDLTLGGFGKFDKKNLRVKSISGYAVGTVTPDSATQAGLCGDTADTAPKVLDTCYEDFTDWCCDGEETDAVVAIGTWSIKYNKSLANGKKTLGAVVPSYAK